MLRKTLEIIISFEICRSIYDDAGDAVRIEDAFEKLLEQEEREPEGRREVHESAQDNRFFHWINLSKPGQIIVDKLKMLNCNIS